MCSLSRCPVLPMVESRFRGVQLPSYPAVPTLYGLTSIPTHTGIIPTERMLTTITTTTTSRSSFLPLPLHRQPMPLMLPPPRDLGIESPGETASSRWQPPDTPPPLRPRSHQRDLSAGRVPKMTTAPPEMWYISQGDGRELLRLSHPLPGPSIMPGTLQFAMGLTTKARTTRC